jgi:hypothetical protein
MHECCASPSMTTVQAPQEPTPQPKRGPFSPKWSRSTKSSGSSECSSGISTDWRLSVMRIWTSVDRRRFGHQGKIVLNDRANTTELDETGAGRKEYPLSQTKLAARVFCNRFTAPQGVHGNFVCQHGLNR